ncbi:MAG: uroporphyrinogen decarboxylase family protein [Chitinophagaceae bacterium]
MKNDLLLKALRKEKVERPPVWMMRQAGRYLPDYMKLKAKYDFFTRVQTPELACEITLQPVDQVGVDAAIIFSDILVIPQAMGKVVLMEEGKGPSLPEVIQNQKDIDALITDNVEESLSYVMNALSMIKQELNGRVPLIGFAGAPFTILVLHGRRQRKQNMGESKTVLFHSTKIGSSIITEDNTISL